MTTPPPLAITQGDPSGIGPEIVLQCFLQQPALCQDAVVLGHRGVLERALSWVDHEHRIEFDELSWGQDGFVSERASSPPADGSKRVIALINLEHWDDILQGVGQGLGEQRALSPQTQGALRSRRLPEMGRIEALSGEMAAQSIVSATRAALLGHVRAVVTAPIHKEALALAMWDYPGHTELLQHECARFLGRPDGALPVRMMLTNDELTVVLVSIHISLKEAISSLSIHGVLETLHITDQALSRSLGRRPKMALSGLNPHAGEGGLMGREEIELLTPALAQARAAGLDVHGPVSPDTVFMRARRTAQRPGEFDAVVALYHDQGLIPIKYLGLDQGVNVTLGLPLVRTSPDHGTAFDLAGLGQARSSSLLQAIQVAQQLSASHAR